MRPACVSGMRLALFKTVGSGLPPCAIAGMALGARVCVGCGVRDGVTGVCGGRVPASAVAALMNAVAVTRVVAVSVGAARDVSVDAGGGAVGSVVGDSEHAIVKVIITSAARLNIRRKNMARKKTSANASLNSLRFCFVYLNSNSLLRRFVTGGAVCVFVFGVTVREFWRT